MKLFAVAARDFVVGYVDGLGWRCLVGHWRAAGCFARLGAIVGLAVFTGLVRGGLFDADVREEARLDLDYFVGDYPTNINNKLVLVIVRSGQLLAGRVVKRTYYSP